MSTLPCMNCKKPVEQDQGKFFTQVYVCETCYTLAQRFHDKLERELKNLLLLSKEAIRVALVQGKFHLSEASLQDISKKEVLEEILRMEGLKNSPHAKAVECPPINKPHPPSGDSTPPHVRTLAALGTSSPPKPNPQD